jgi:DNA-binding CsgD family transcriptional regulator
MDRDRCAALGYFVRFLSGNPEGDAAARALINGALAPVGVTAGQIYAIAGTDTLELVGNFGYTEDEAAALRALPLGLPLPICDAVTSMQPVTVTPEDLVARYPLLETQPSIADSTSVASGGRRIICVPIVYSGVPIGGLSVMQTTDDPWEAADWSYLEAVGSAVGMWMNNQRQILVEKWRRGSPPPQREVRITDRQRQILEMIGDDQTNGEIARELGYSIPTIKKDLQHIMRILGTQDRRNTAGRAREIGLLPERRQRD